MSYNVNSYLTRQDAGVVKMRGGGQRRDAHCTCKHCQTGSPNDFMHGDYALQHVISLVDWPKHVKFFFFFFLQDSYGKKSTLASEDQRVSQKGLGTQKKSRFGI